MEKRIQQLAVEAAESFRRRGQELMRQRLPADECLTRSITDEQRALCSRIAHLEAELARVREAALAAAGLCSTALPRSGLTIGETQAVGHILTRALDGGSDA